MQHECESYANQSSKHEGPNDPPKDLTNSAFTERTRRWIDSVNEDAKAIIMHTWHVGGKVEWEYYRHGLRPAS